MQTIKTWAHWTADLFWMFIDGLTWYVAAAVLIGVIALGIVIGNGLS